MDINITSKKSNSALPQKKRILLVASRVCVFRDPCRKALIKFGFEIVDFDYKSGLYFRFKIIRRLSRITPFSLKIIKGIVNKNTNRRFKKAIDKFCPDIVFGLKADTIIPESVIYAKNRGILTLNWYSDFAWQWNNIIRIAPVYDFFFSQDHHVLRLLRERGINNCYYLPSASDIDEGSPNPFINRDEKYNIAVICSYSDNPNIYLNRINYFSAIKSLGLKIWGAEGWAKSPLKKFYQGRAPWGSIFDIYRKSKIVINIHNFSKEPTEGITLRPFEAMGSGAMLISDDIRSDIFRLFKDGEEFVSFHDGDANQLKEKVQYYLSHPEERLRIAKNGYKKIISKHTYLTRMKEMLDIMSSSKDSLNS